MVIFYVIINSFVFIVCRMENFQKSFAYNNFLKAQKNDQCDNTFYDKLVLKRHKMDIHSDGNQIKMYKTSSICNICEKAFHKKFC